MSDARFICAFKALIFEKIVDGSVSVSQTGKEHHPRSDIFVSWFTVLRRILPSKEIFKRPDGLQYFMKGVRWIEVLGVDRGQERKLRVDTLLKSPEAIFQT